jgi:glutathione peroxidase
MPSGGRCGVEWLAMPDHLLSLTDFSARLPDGSDVDLAAYDGHVALVVNTASQCGYASQLPGLQRLHEAYADRGFTVLAFPSDQFRQEPLADGDLGAVCERHRLTFPLFAKVAVNGRDAHPLFRWLRSQRRGLLGGRVNWNFTKFLVGRDGRVLRRYGPTTEPEAITADIEAALDG